MCGQAAEAAAKAAAAVEEERRQEREEEMRQATAQKVGCAQCNRMLLSAQWGTSKGEAGPHLSFVLYHAIFECSLYHRRS